MASELKKDGDEPRKPRQAPATTPEGREHQLIDLAVDLAEKQIREGTVSAQVLSHYLKMSSPRERLDRQKLETENDMLRKRIETMESAQNVEVLYKEALAAMRRYSGTTSEEVFED